LKTANKNSGSLAKVAVVVVLVAVICLAIYTQSGNSPDVENPNDGNLGTTNQENELLTSAKGLLGIWNGTSYAGDLSSFSPTKPFQTGDSGRVISGDANAKVAAIDVTIEITEELLGRKGFESCWVTLTYRPTNEDPAHSSRDMYRLFPPKEAVSRNAEPGERGEAELQPGTVGLPHWKIEDRYDSISLKKGLDKLEIVKLQGAEMQLVGKIGIVGHKMERPRIILTLQRQVESKSAE